MTSKIDVVNQALGELGRPPVIQYTDSPDATTIWFLLDTLLPELLLRTDWNFAIKYITLTTPLSESFSPDFLYTYQLPGDYGRLDRISPQTANFGLYYRIIDGFICTNSNPLNLYYVVNNADYSVLPPIFVRALVYYVAYSRALILSNNLELTAYLKQNYLQKMDDAIRENDMDRYVQSTPFNDFDRQIFI